MKKPVRALIDGTAIGLAVILFVVIVVLLSHCGSEKRSDSTASPVEVLTGQDGSSEAVGQDSVSRGRSQLKTEKRESVKTRKSRHSKKERSPKEYPERSPLDEPV